MAALNFIKIVPEICEKTSAEFAALSLAWTLKSKQVKAPLNLIKIEPEICEKTSAEFAAFSYNCELEWRSRSFKLVSNNTV